MKYWTPESFEISSYRNSLSERINQQYNGSGSDNTGKCIYTYNELGFRGDIINKKGFKIMSLGCSLTEGVGVNDNETWPAQFTSLIPNGVNLNFGTGGRSNDFISRCLLTYYDLIKPDLVLIMYTESHRREFFTEDGGVEPFHYNSWGYFDEIEKGKEEHSSFLTLSNQKNDFQNWYKNHLLISNFLKNKKCNWLWNGWFATNSYKDNNRFDGNYSSPFMDYGVDGAHPGPKHNEQYSIHLFNHIYTFFRNYLPKDTNNSKYLI